MDKNKIHKNILKMIDNGFFLNKYIELTGNTYIDESNMEENARTIQFLENMASSIFNAILIGCQLFDDEERIIKFVNEFSAYLNAQLLEISLNNYDITEKEACERLKHGFGVHFTTPKICDEIRKKGYLAGYGKNEVFTKEENKIIENASKKQRENDPKAESKLNFLFKGWGTGVSSYGSMTNGFGMYHTPESLSFLFGNISKRDKKDAIDFVTKNISTLSEEEKKTVIDTMTNIYDRLVGEKKEVECILIDRDTLNYETVYSYDTDKPVPLEVRPFSNGLEDLMLEDNKINKDIKIENLRFVKIPTIFELEKRKNQSINFES